MTAAEVYLQAGRGPGAERLLKMVRDIQRELERENVVLSYSHEPPHLRLEYVEREISRLIECARSARGADEDIEDDTDGDDDDEDDIEDEVGNELVDSYTTTTTTTTTTLGFDSTLGLY
jgi:hypothetical protein